MSYQSYGIDWEGPVPVECDEDTVIVPEIAVDLSDEERLMLKNICEDQHADSSDEVEWIALYIECKQLIYGFIPELTG